MRIPELAEKYGFKRQAIYVKVREKKLPATKIGGRFFIEEADYVHYLKNKYKRDPKIHDKEKGFYSVKEAATFLNVSPNRIYYLLKMGSLKFHRHRTTYVLHIDDLIASTPIVIYIDKRNPVEPKEKIYVR